MATTSSAQSVISTAETLFEGFVADNYYFLNITECIEWIRTVIKPFVKREEVFDSWVCLKSWNDTRDRIYSRILNPQDNDEEILGKFLEGFTDEELTVLYYKNNLLEFIGDHDEIQELIIEIFENVENLEYAEKEDSDWFSKIPSKYQKDFVGKEYKEWNKFVDNQFFMNPNDVPETISNTLYALKEYLMKYIYCQYLSVDRIYRLKNFKRKVVTVIDTDSNILSLDTSIDFIMDNVVKGETFGRSFMNNIFICVNMLAYVLTDAVTDILLTYGKHSNIPEEFRPIYNMKNEFLMLKLVIGKTKKRYISKIMLREGNLMNPPKYDIKGFDFKKATTSEYAEEFYMGLIKKYIINSEDIELRNIIHDLKEFKKDVRQSIEDGDRRFLPNISAKEFGAYKNPNSQQSVKAVLAWNMLYPNNTIELPTKVSLLKLNIFDEDDITPLKDTNPEFYDVIMDKIFNDETGIFVQKSWDPGINYINPNTNDKDWVKEIPEKYRTKYRKLGVKEWNKFVDGYDFDAPDAYKGEWKYKKVGMQSIAIPSNSDIPEWLQPYIDFSTIVNNIMAPFIPVLEIFQSKTIEEGKLRKGVNRKTNAFSNIVKF